MWPGHAVHAHQPSGAQPYQPESFPFGHLSSRNCRQDLCFLACTISQVLVDYGARVRLCCTARSLCLPQLQCWLFLPQTVGLKEKKGIIIGNERVTFLLPKIRDNQKRKGLVMGLKMFDDVPSGYSLAYKRRWVHETAFYELLLREKNPLSQ